VKSVEFSRKDREHILGTDVGTGSGAHLSIDEIEQTGKVITGYEMIEACCAAVGDKPFSLSYLFEQLVIELKYGTMTMIEHPAPGNQFGKFRYNNTHPYYVNGWPKSVGKRHWYRDVMSGLDPGLHK